jgi:UDPglucose 6-dehydrogenase/GDP-mannose 6-dehydrogenase
MQVCVVGAGYVGLVTGACLADTGHSVVLVDLDPSKIDAINSGRAPIHEAGLPDLLARTVGRTLRATTELAPEIRWSEVVLIAVGTPLRDGAIDLGAIRQASADIGRALRGAKGSPVVTVRSTVVPGTTEGLVREVLEHESGKTAGMDFGLGMNPEFLTEGQALADFQQQDRIVIGALDPRSREVLAALYQSFPPGVPRIFVNPRTAEMIKYASNALLATSISFANELADVASAVGGIDIVDVMRGVHASRYLSGNGAAGPWTASLASYLEAGCGYGGSCLPKDVKALVAHARGHGVEPHLLSAVDRVNTGRPERLLELARRHHPSLRDLRVSVLGVAFKPDTDDVRETPAAPVVRALLEDGARVTVYDPIVPAGTVMRLFGPAQVRVAASMADAVADAQVVIVVTRWAEFLGLPRLLADRSDPPLVVDGRRLLDPKSLARYEGVGR